MNELIRQWLVEVLGYSAQNIIRGSQEGPIPLGDYATYQLVSGVTSQYSLETSVGAGDDLVVTWYNKGMYSFQVDVYASDAVEKQHNLTQSGYLLSVREILQPAYTVLRSSGSIQEIDELMDTKHKIRAQCDHVFALWNTITEAGSKANGYKIYGNYQPDDVDIIIEASRP